MLARKAVVGQVKGDMLVIAQGRRRSANVALDLSPMMWQVVYGIAALVACLLIMMVMNAYSTKLGYEVVKTQQAVVQLTKDNDALDVEVASLKSPVRIQQLVLGCFPLRVKEIVYETLTRYSKNLTCTACRR